jgi:hypothetical protein
MKKIISLSLHHKTKLLILTVILGLLACSEESDKDKPAPLISSIAPTSGVAGTPVTITGSNFDPDKTKNKISFNGKTAEVVSATKTQIVAKVPEDAGTGNVTLTIEGKMVQGPLFTFLATPVILSIEPQTAFIGDTLKITGKNFSTDLAGNVIQINGKALTIISASATSIQAKIPNGITKGILSITTNGLTVISTSEVKIFELPTVTDVTPLLGPKTTIVTISGTGFSDVANENAVTINGKNAEITSATTSQLKVAVPPSAGDGPVIVTARGKMVVNRPEFRYQWTAEKIAGTDQTGYADGNKSNALFNRLYGIAVFVNDAGNKRVRKISAAGDVSLVAGSGANGFSDGSANSAEFSDLRGVAVDQDNTIYVCDFHRVRKITSAGVVTTLAGYVAEGFIDGQGANAHFNIANGIVVDNAKNLFVADRLNHAIRKISPNGEVTTFAGGSQGNKDGEGKNAQFSYPVGLAIDTNDNIYLTDLGSSRIRKITPQGKVTTIAGSSAGHVDGTLNEARFLPDLLAIACDKNQNLYIIEYSQDTITFSIRKLSFSGRVTTIFNGPGYASAIAVDPEGALYIARGSMIVKID